MFLEDSKLKLLNYMRPLAVKQSSEHFIHSVHKHCGNNLSDGRLSPLLIETCPGSIHQTPLPWKRETNQSRDAIH